MNLRSRPFARTGIVLATTLALGLAGCTTPNTTIQITITFPGSQSTGKGQTKSRALTADTVLSLDAGSASTTFNSSGGILSDSGVMTVKLWSAGNVVAQQQFGTHRSGNTFTASNPASVNNWVHAYAGLIDEVDVTIDNVKFQDIQGTNSVTVSANYSGSSYASATTTYQGLNYQHY